MKNHRFSIKRLGGNKLRPIAAGLVLAFGAGAALQGVPAANAQAQDVATAPLKVESIQQLTENTGWVAGTRGLFWTDDNGASWSNITPPGMETSSIQAVTFLDVGHGWVTTASDTGGELAVAITDDGGATWISRPLATLGEEGGLPISIDFVDSQHGFVMVRRPSSANFSIGALFATTDGGQTWEQLPTPPIAGEINLVSPTDAWLAGGPAGDQLHVTHNGGESWERQFVASHSASDKQSPPVYRLPTFSSDSNGVLPVLFGGAQESVLVMYETSDGGATWSSKSTAALAGDAGINGVVVASVDADTVIVASDNRAGLTVMAQGAQRSSPLSGTLSAQQAITGMDFHSASQGWLQVASGHCEEGKTLCRQESRLFITVDGGHTLEERTPLVATGEVGINRVVLSASRGFDKCAVGTVSQMQAWFTGTPWSFANFYMGGGNRACAQPGLNSSWITSMFNQGWLLLPTWVGLQAPGSVCGGCSIMSTNTATARTQGINEANAASDAAANLGLGPTIIYFDMERYDPTSHPAVKAFIDAWVLRLRERGHQAGVYGAGINAANDWAPIANVPQAVWIAQWNSNDNLFGLSGLPDNLWNMRQRIRQHQGGHNETWGGVTFNIDSNRADGPLVDN